MRTTIYYVTTALVACFSVFFIAAQEVDVEPSVSSSENSSERKEEEKRLWGSPSNDGSEERASAAKEDSNSKDGSATGGNHIPFVPKASGTAGSAHTIHYEPPEGFRITSRVYTDPKDKLAHFDNDSTIVFPYWECGITGSTTVPIPLQHATVRYLLGGSQPNLYSGEEFGPHPQLVVALTSLEVALNSGQVQTFKAGDVILLEDVLSGGHKMKGHDQQDMTVMILTLSEHYHRVGKDKSSIQHIFAKDKSQYWKMNPCNTGLDQYSQQRNARDFGTKFAMAFERFRPRSVRRNLLTVVGLSVSALMADFMGKVAPLWLAVAIGGGFFVSAGTYGFVKVGDYALDELDMWRERRQFRLQGSDGSSDDGEINTQIPPIHAAEGDRPPRATEQ